MKFVLSLKIRRLRNKKGYSLKELAKKSGLSHSYLNEIEKGKKYPKTEKLKKLAEALEVEVTELVKAKMGRELHPLLSFLESDLATSLPLSAFGIAEQDVYDLMSHSPEKFTSFLMTVSELAKSFDVSIDDLNKAAIRAYLEVNNNHFPYLEELATSFSRSLKESMNGRSDKEVYQFLVNKLENEFQVVVDNRKIGIDPRTKGIVSLFKYQEGGHRGILFLNPFMDDKHKIFALVKELGAQHLISDDALKERDPFNNHFSDLLLEYQTEYFAGAALVPEESLKADVKSFFSEDSFNPQFLLSLFEKYRAPAEFVMARLTQILPHHFGLNQLFFLRCNEDIEEAKGRYFIDQELHLGQLHHPHGVSLREHYCRRWITIDLLRKANRDGFQVGGQVSQMGDEGKPYFCLSFAQQNALEEHKLTCYTMGIAIDNNLSKQVGSTFYSNIEKRVVGRTCERCSISDCGDRVSPPSISLRFEEDQKRRELIKTILE